MYLSLKHTQVGNSGSNIATLCPHCGHNGTFTSALPHDLICRQTTTAGAVEVIAYLGLRKCPNEQCHGQMFVIRCVNNFNNNTLITYPSRVIPFDKINIPQQVLVSFEEAVICHSNACFIASAIMIRKTLEMICEDRRATGNNLYQKLLDLAGHIMIPQELKDGMQELRLLGNDAAHIEAKTFEQVGKEEIEISIEFTKEILKAVYQYESLLSKIRSLKILTPPGV